MQELLVLALTDGRIICATVAARSTPLADRCRQSARIDYHTEAVEELDVEDMLAFAERILPRAANLWVQASLDYRQRLQELFFPDGIAHDGVRFNRTAVTAPLFRYVEPDERPEESLASLAGFVPAGARERAARLRTARGDSNRAQRGRWRP